MSIPFIGLALAWLENTLSRTTSPLQPTGLMPLRPLPVQATP